MCGRGTEPPHECNILEAIDPAENSPGDGFPGASIDLSPELNCHGFCTVLSASYHD